MRRPKEDRNQTRIDQWHQFGAHIFPVVPCLFIQFLCRSQAYCLFALTMMSIGISQTTSMAPDATKARVSTSSVFSLVDRELKIDPSNESGATIEDVKGDIEFQHVSFRYPTRPNVQIFRDVCLAVQISNCQEINLLFRIPLLLCLLPCEVIQPALTLHCFENEHIDCQELTIMLPNLDFLSQKIALVGESGS